MKHATSHRERPPTAKIMSAGEWLQRLLLQVASQAQNDLPCIATNPKTAIHSLRKRMKKLRALLRLAVPALDEESIETLKAGIREIKDAATSRRDADVLSALGRELGVTLSSPPLARPDRSMLDAFVCELVATFERMDLSALEWADVTDNHLKTCRRARKAWKKAREHPTSENLHEWRKRVKDQYHQSLALHHWLGQMGKLRRVRRLGSLLGRCHDLDLFAATIDTGGKVKRKIGSRNKKLQRRVFRRAKKVFSPSLSKSRRRLASKLLADLPKSQR